MALITVSANQAKDKPFKLADGKGLYLQVRPNGGKYWRSKYHFDDKEDGQSNRIDPPHGNLLRISHRHMNRMHLIKADCRGENIHWSLMRAREG